VSDPNHAHEFRPNRKGKCQHRVGGRRSGYRICHQGPDAEVHQRFTPPQHAHDEAQRELLRRILHRHASEICTAVESGCQVDTDRYVREILAVTREVEDEGDLF
jgi:hypothetical protein